MKYIILLTNPVKLSISSYFQKYRTNNGILCVNHEEIALKQFSVQFLLAQAVGVPVGPPLGGRLATTLVATIFIIIFHFFLRRDLFS